MWHIANISVAIAIRPPDNSSARSDVLQVRYVFDLRCPHQRLIVSRQWWSTPRRLLGRGHDRIDGHYAIEEAGKALGKPGDEGIDGIIKEDRLGLDVIYLQAKPWERTIGRPDIQQSAGALQGQRARKGVFITTSSFSDDAKQYAERIDTRIILIDGTELARLMIALGVGVTPVAVYELKRVDSDFFVEE